MAPPPRPPLPPGLVAALGAAVIGGCGPCLDIATDSGQTQSDTGTTGTGTNGSEEGADATRSRDEVIRGLDRNGALPPDVAARLGVCSSD